MDYLALTLPGGKKMEPIADVPSGGLDVVSSAISVAFSLMIIVAILAALIYLVLGGIQWTSSGGDKGKIAAARSKITFAIIGMLVAIGGFFIVNLFGGFFGVNLLGGN